MLVNEGPDRVRELMEICPRFDKVDGQIVLGPRGRALAAAHRARRRRRHRQRGLERPRRGGPRRQPRAALRGRVRHRPAHGGRPLRRRAHAEPRRRRAHAQRGHGDHPRHRRRRAGLRAHHQPAGRDRRRRRHGLPRRRRDPRPRVRAVPSHGPGRARPADRAAHHRGAARRGRLPAQRRRRALHDGATTRAPSWPRATSSCAAWSPRCAARAATTSTSTPRTSMPPGCRSGSRASPRACAEHGLDLATQLIPVAPVCHYFIGGVVTDVWGRTTVPGLYASGEVASTGVHGANRLASNSLLEGLVFSRPRRARPRPLHRPSRARTCAA